MKKKTDTRIVADIMASKDFTVTRCTNHTGKINEFECKDHCETFCHACAAIFHKKCKHVHFLDHREKQTSKLDIEDVSHKESTKNESRKHKAVMRLSKSFDDKDETMPKYIDPQTLSKDFARARSIEEIRKNVLPNVIVQRKLSKTVKDTHSHDKKQESLDKRQGKLITHAGRTLSKLFANKSGDDERSDAKEKADDFCDHSANSSNRINSFVEAAPPLHDTTHFDTHFLQQSGLQDILEESEDIISVSVNQNVSKSHIMLENEIYIRTHFDQKCCTVTGLCVLPDGRMLLADEANGTVKLFQSNGEFLAHLRLESEPFDITAIENHEAAVSCPTSKCIHIMLVEEALFITRTIHLEKICYGITYHCGEIYVTLENEVRILTCDGKVVRKISTEFRGKKRFSWPLLFPKSMFSSARYVSVNTEQQNVVIMVSDSMKICFICMTKHGKILSRLRLDIDGVPSGMCAGIRGQLFVCQAPNKLIAINSDAHGHRIKTVLELDAIQNVYFHAFSKSLWVTRRANNFVMTYKVNDSESW